MDVPPDWKSNIQSGIGYSTETEAGRNLWYQIESRLYRYLKNDLEPSKSLANDSNQSIARIQFHHVKSENRAGIIQNFRNRRLSEALPDNRRKNPAGSGGGPHKEL